MKQARTGLVFFAEKNAKVKMYWTNSSTAKHGWGIGYWMIMHYTRHAPDLMKFHATFDRRLKSQPYGTNAAVAILCESCAIGG